MRLTDSLEFPFLLTKSIEMGLFKTYSSPATSKLLCSTKQMTTYCAKRYDDTDLLIREFTENKYGTDRAEKAIERMNFLHSSYVIDNEEYLYNLGIFMCFPPEMINKIGYRKLEKVEIEARYIKWCEIGRRMNLKDIPESFEAMQKFMEDFEERNFEYSKFNEQIMLATTGLFLAKFPTFVHPFLRQVTSAMCTPLMRKSLGMAEPMYGMTFAVESLMKGVGLFTRYFVLPRSEPYRRTQIHGGSSDTLKCVYHTFEETYKDGYVIGELGPLKFKKL
ncbi:hypothetical protein HK098_004476 [Nowakowskiella sp. JEL0407]|nr:hypothetical protein HK098_004476 [Nowakowskiella sp. JEL0407]